MCWYFQTRSRFTATWYKNLGSVVFLFFLGRSSDHHIKMTSVIIACSSSGAVGEGVCVCSGWVWRGVYFQVGCVFVLFMFLNKAFITAWPARASSALSNVGWVGWLLEPWLSHVWMYHRSPTSLSFCITMTVVTYLLLDWQDEWGFRGDFFVCFLGGMGWGEGGGEEGRRQVEDGWTMDRWEKEATLKLHDHCEKKTKKNKKKTTFRSILFVMMIYFFMGVKKKKKNQKNTQRPLSCSPWELFTDIKRENSTSLLDAVPPVWLPLVDGLARAARWMDPPGETDWKSAPQSPGPDRNGRKHWLEAGPGSEG